MKSLTQQAQTIVNDDYYDAELSQVVTVVNGAAACLVGATVDEYQHRVLAIRGTVLQLIKHWCSILQCTGYWRLGTLAVVNKTLVFNTSEH